MESELIIEICLFAHQDEEVEDFRDDEQLADVAPATNARAAAEEESADSRHNERGWSQVKRALKLATPEAEELVQVQQAKIEKEAAEESSPRENEAREDDDQSESSSSSSSSSSTSSSSSSGSEDGSKEDVAKPDDKDVDKMDLEPNVDNCVDRTPEDIDSEASEEVKEVTLGEDGKTRVIAKVAGSTAGSAGAVEGSKMTDAKKDVDEASASSALTLCAHRQVLCCHRRHSTK